MHADTKLVTQTPASCHMQVLPPIRQELLPASRAKEAEPGGKSGGRMAGLAHVSVFPQGSFADETAFSESWPDNCSIVV